MLLPKREPVIMPGGKVADVQASYGEPRDLSHLPLRKESLGDAALIENLDGACGQTTCARTRKVLVRTPLDDRDVDSGQRQLCRQHQPGRTSSGDHYRMLGHLVPPVRRLRFSARDYDVRPGA